MILVAPVGGALALVWLSRTPRLSWPGGAAAVLALAALVFAAPDRMPLAATVAVEAAVAAVLAGRLGLDAPRAALASGFVNAITQPLLFAGLPRLPGAGGPAWLAPLAVAEGLVVVAEAALYVAALSGLRQAPRPVARALALSFVANAASLAAGLALPL